MPRSSTLRKKRLHVLVGVVCLLFTSVLVCGLAGQAAAAPRGWLDLNGTYSGVLDFGDLNVMVDTNSTLHLRQYDGNNILTGMVEIWAKNIRVLGKIDGYGKGYGGGGGGGYALPYPGVPNGHPSLPRPGGIGSPNPNGEPGQLGIVHSCIGPNSYNYILCVDLGPFCDYEPGWGGRGISANHI